MRARDGLVMVMLVVGLAVGCNDDRKPSAPDPARDRFVAIFVPKMLDSACGDAGSYFRTCFIVTEAECRTELHRTLDACLPDIPFPGHVDGETGAAFGRAAGQCAGTQYEIDLVHAGKRMSDPACNDMSRWAR